MTKNNQRIGSFDILKIVAILFIILHHYALWTEWNFPPGFQINKLAAQTLLIGGKLGVNLFVMITGYFLVQSNPKVSSLFQIWVETTLISVFMYFLLVLNPLISFNFTWTEFFMRLFPVIFGKYWFVTSYTIMYLSVPVLNKSLHITSLDKIKKVLTVSFFILSLYTCVYYNRGLNFSYPVWFVFLYSIGAYLKLKEEDIKRISTIHLFKMNILMLLIGIIINIILQFIFSEKTSTISQFLTLLGWNETIFYTRDSSPYLLIFSILIFLFFLKLKVKPRKVYSFLSRASFGAYLLQSTQWFSTEYLWPVLVHGNRFTSGKFIIMYGFFVSIIIFVIGILLYIILLPVIKFILNICSKYLNWLQVELFR